MKRSAAALAALLTLAAAPPGGGWSSTAGLSPDGDPLLGNPAASVVLTEHVAYTCADCTRYALQSEAVLRLAYLPSGRLAIAVRLSAETPVDLALAMAARCGPPQRFFLNHSALLRGQPQWGPRIARATPAQRLRWHSGPLGSRNRAIAADLGLYAVMAGRGYDRLTLDRCLADPALAARITARSAAAKNDGITQTPGFSINGKLLQATRDWATLRPQLDQALR